jgi:hypothetical protein
MLAKSALSRTIMEPPPWGTTAIEPVLLAIVVVVVVVGTDAVVVGFVAVVK